MLDLEKFVDGFDLEKSMNEFRKDMTYSGKARFYKTLKNAKYLVPYGKEDSIPLISPTKDTNFIAVYTNVNEMEKQGSYANNKMKIMSFRDILSIFIEHYPRVTGIALNPFGKTLFLGREQIDDIQKFTDGMTLRRVDYEKPQELLLWDNASEEMKNRLRKYCQEEDSIKRIWILGARRSKDENFHIQFLVEFSDVKREKIFMQVAEIVKKYMMPGQSFEIMQATEESAYKANLISRPIFDVNALS